MNPRLWKEAFFYEKKGFKVTIITMWQSEQMLLKDKAILNGHEINYESYLNLIVGQVNPAVRFFYRLRKRIGNELQRFFKIGTRWAISHAPEKMYKKVLSLNADLYAAHLECSFFVGRDLIKVGKNVSFDFEDWYSHDYLVPERPVKLLEKLEKFALQKGLFCTAASASMAIALKDYYKISNELVVVYNGFPRNVTQPIYKNDDLNYHEEKVTRLLWFSRTIGADRGLEFILKALLVCDIPIELHLLGEMSEGYNDFLQSSFDTNSKHSLVIHPFIPHSELEFFLSQFKIGLAIEENINENKSLTISNKILQYLQAGLHVIASNTKGQKEVAAHFPESIQIIDLNNSSKIVSAIKFFKEKEKVNHHAQFEKIFSWEAQEEKFSKLIEQHL
jgi:glycosyltransferase involved in cell wall biosynthesis